VGAPLKIASARVGPISGSVAAGVAEMPGAIGQTKRAGSTALVILGRKGHAHPLGGFTKRLLDILLATAILIVAAPIMLAVAALMLLAERAQSERLRHLLAQLRRAQFGRSYCANAGSIPPAGVLTSSPRTDGPCSFQGAAHARGELGWTLLVQGFLTFGVDA
jgi:hypothetical protein